MERGSQHWQRCELLRLSDPQIVVMLTTAPRILRGKLSVFWENFSPDMRNPPREAGGSHSRVAGRGPASDNSELPQLSHCLQAFFGHWHPRSWSDRFRFGRSRYPERKPHAENHANHRSVACLERQHHRPCPVLSPLQKGSCQTLSQSP